MIVENQSNLKVHFAGSEEVEIADIASRVGNVEYYLFSVFKFIAKDFGIKNVDKKVNKNGINIPTHIEKLSRHSIMDSGLFTLMFGAHANKWSEKQLEHWYQLLLKFVNENKYKGTCVEIDCQKIFGISKAWEFRNRMKKDLPNNRQINVFHKEDGQKGLDRMIEFSDYIAISVPELRALGQKNYTEKIAYYIKNKKPSIDIHLLGCTEKKLLKELKFCSSSDSTSWIQVNRYGVMNANGYKIKVNQFNDKFYLQYKSDVKNMLDFFKMNHDKNKYEYYARYGFAAMLLKKEYQLYAGPQD